MIELMVSETKRVFKGTTNKKYYLFYHDALSLMTEKEDRNWMKEKGYEEILILTEMDLLASKPFLKCYIGHPPCNIPELCNIDSCINKDLHKAVDCRVGYTHLLHKLDPKKFSIATPKKGTSVYLGYFIQLTASLYQSKGSYPTCMMYSYQSSILWRTDTALSQISRMWKTCRRGGKGKLGGLRTPIMGEI